MAAITVTISNPNRIFTFSNCPQIPLHHQSYRFSPIKIRSKSHRSKLGFTVCSTRRFDVVVVGAGIIGLSIARQLLLHSNLSVAVVDASVPCSGATGAGQGYLWMAHKQPGTSVWDLAMRSQILWQLLADTVQDEGFDPLEALGWKKTGSLLIGRTEAELNQLKRQVRVLSEAGVRAEYLSGNDLTLKEPELGVDQEEAGAAFLPDDCQLDAYRTVSYMQNGNKRFAPQGRYEEFFNDPAVGFIRSSGEAKIEGIKTKKNTIYATEAVVIAAGCWTGSLMHELLRDSDIVLDIPVKPRKGFLLVLENFKGLRLNHGLMEAGYINHKESVVSAPGNVDQGALSISMTATVDVHGNLLIGSSRQFTGFNTEPDMFIVNRIWERAQEYFPALRDSSLEHLSQKMNVRIGLRPYMPDGRPVIGPVPGIPNVILATGHEGGGLSMALGTAEMVTDMVLENPLHIDYSGDMQQGSNGNNFSVFPQE